MNSSSITKCKITMALSMATALTLGTGCSSMHRQARYNAQPAPIVMNNSGQAAGTYAMGGTSAGYESQTGSASSLSQPAAQPANAQNAQSSQIVIPLERETMSIGKQQVNDGSVRIRKFVRSETVSKPVTVRQESVTVDRLPANAAQGGIGSQSQSSQGQVSSQNNSLSTPFKPGEMTINLSSEQPLVQTQVVPAGSVVIRKQETTKPITVQGQVRREEVVAEPVGNPQNVNISGDLKGSPQAGASNPSAYSQGASSEASGGTPAASEQSSGAGSSSAGASGSAITQLNQLTSASDPTTLAGQTVNLSNARVQRVIGPSLVAISSGSGTPIYVHTAQPASGLSAGQTVSVNGTVKQVPSSTSSLGWDPQSTQALQGQQIFIEAPSLTPSNQ